MHTGQKLYPQKKLGYWIRVSDKRPKKILKVTYRFYVPYTLAIYVPYTK